MRIIDAHKIKAIPVPIAPDADLCVLEVNFTSTGKRDLAILRQEDRTRAEQHSTA